MRKKATSSRPAVGKAPPAPRTPASTVAGGNGLLIVVELGGHWPDLSSLSLGHAQAHASGATDTAAGLGQRRVVAQIEGETPAAFAERVTNGFDGLFGKGVALGALVLACNERIDSAADSARRQLAGLALGTMAKHRAGKVYLAASPLSSGRLRHALAGLAQGLFDEWRTAGLEVTTELGGGRPVGGAPTPPTFGLERAS
jgi:hypothetical protein